MAVGSSPHHAPSRAGSCCEGNRQMRWGAHLSLNKQKSGSRTRSKEGNYITLLNKEALAEVDELYDKNAPLPLLWIA